MIESLAARLLPAAALHRRPETSGEVPLFQEGGVLVTSERVVVDGRSQALAEVLRVESVRRSPRMKPWLLTLALSAAVALPAHQALLAAGTALAEGLLVAAGLAIFGSIARIVLAEDAYQVVLHTRRGAWRVLSSREPAPATRLAGVLQEATDTARRRR